MLDEVELASALLRAVKMVDEFSQTLEDFSNNAIFEALALCKKTVLPLLRDI